MKEFSGGVSRTDNHIKINLSIQGGTNQTRVYDNNIQLSINKLTIVNEALSKLSIETLNDIKFYINGIIALFKMTNIDFLPLNGQYQLIYNIKLLIIYTSSCINKSLAIVDSKQPSVDHIDEMIQLLNCNRMIQELNIDTQKNIKISKESHNSIQSNKVIIEQLNNENNCKKLCLILKDLIDQYINIIISKKSDIEKIYQNNISNINKILT